jgi:hypothetical protein
MGELVRYLPPSSCTRLYEFEDRAVAKGGFGSIHIGRKRVAPGSEGDEVVLKLLNLHGATMRKFNKMSTANLGEIRKYISR